mgnify:FL=1
MAFLSESQLRQIGFKSLGENVLISDKVSIYNAENISLGSYVRVDDFCILSAGERGIEIGSFVHLAAYTSLMGAERIILEDFVGLSSKVSLFSSSDDYMGYSLTNPMVPSQYKRVKSLPVTLKKHALVGAHSVLLPGASLEEGVSIGAMSVVSSKLDAWHVYMGNPAKKIVRRSKKLLQSEQSLKQDFPNVSFIGND